MPQSSLWQPQSDLPRNHPWDHILSPSFLQFTAYAYQCCATLSSSSLLYASWKLTTVMLIPLSLAYFLSESCSATLPPTPTPTWWPSPFFLSILFLFNLPFSSNHPSFPVQAHCGFSPWFQLLYCTVFKQRCSSEMLTRDLLFQFWSHNFHFNFYSLQSQTGNILPGMS